MPLYATEADLVAAMGHDEVGAASDNEATGSYNKDSINAAIRLASSDIESYALPYGLVPTDVGANELANAGTFPAWWTEACKEIALYTMSIDGGTWTKEKTSRADYWRKRLDASYPTQINGKPVGGTVSIVGGPREFSRDKVAGL